RFPRITIRDQVRVEALLADYLGVERFALVAGGSMGGMRVLEWCALYPERVDAAWLGATSAFASADQIGTQTTQIQAILADPDWHGGDYALHGTTPATGLGIARRIAHLTYRTEAELAIRFGRDEQVDESPLAATGLAQAYADTGHRYAVQSYLDHHADKLIGRFDAGSYVALTDAMTTHDLGRDRGGVAAALARIEVPLVVAGIDSDRLYPLRLQQQIVDAIPSAAPLRVIESPYGHDAFLLEAEAVGAQLREALELAQSARRRAHCA
ncbi:MAG: Homoserine O-acetyltransferase, partial [Actinomycetota bacterium]|nr:Homoserine O-acetyltransferase [Actinomycetota bacterium]